MNVFETTGGDRILGKYVGLFPDSYLPAQDLHAQGQEYYDFWEPASPTTTSAIMTKRWLDIGGGCVRATVRFGSSSVSRSTLAGWIDQCEPALPRAAHPRHRLGGQGANVGLSGRRCAGAGWQHSSWFILMSHQMQRKRRGARRGCRARLATREGLGSYDVIDHARNGVSSSRARIGTRAAALPLQARATRIGLTNSVRRLITFTTVAAAAPFRSLASIVNSYLRWRYPRFDAPRGGILRGARTQTSRAVTPHLLATQRDPVMSQGETYSITA